MSDPNMNTLREWAAQFPVLNSIPENLQNSNEKLISIIDSVNSCLGKEFQKDKTQFIKINKREPELDERYEVLCMDYELERKEQFLNCIKECIAKEISEIEEKYQLNLALRLWSGCLDAAKVLSLRTQSGKNTAETRRLFIPTVQSRASEDKIYMKGAEIACLWEPNPRNVSFEGVPRDSFVRKYETEWSKREGIRTTKECRNV